MTRRTTSTLWTRLTRPIRAARLWEQMEDRILFDAVPDGGIYGSFFVTLTFDVPDQSAHCSVKF